jgi:hypothetical protein
MVCSLKRGREMKKYTLLLLATALCICCSSIGAHAVDMGQIENDLKGPGVTGWIHGAVHERNLYVFTYRNPKNFFDYVEMSLITNDPATQTKLEGLNRHDKILVKGSFMQNPSPQKHILATSVDIVEKYKSGSPVDPYQHEAKVPDELLKLTTALFLVHAIAGDGHILVVEYKDQVLPIFVHNADLTKGLFRNDSVQLKFSIQGYPDNPTHLILDERDPEPLKVVDSIKSLHGKPASVKGALIMFPKSPEILFNVFAVQQELPGSLKRQFTLVNMDDPAAFKKIREALQAAWDRHPGQFVNARNKLLSTKIQVTATGIFNEVDPSQANPQILLKTVDDIKIED